MVEKTSEELAKELADKKYEQDKNDPNRFDGSGSNGESKTIWTDGDYFRTLEDSRYQKRS